MPQTGPDRTSDHVRWASLANDLLRASLTLRERTPFGAVTNSTPVADFVRPMLLLRVFCLESFFKAMWLKAGGLLASAGTSDQVPGVDNHDLVALAKKVGFVVPPKEEDCLSRLTHIGVFSLDPAEHGRSFWSTADEDHWDAIVRRLDARLRE